MEARILIECELAGLGAEHANGDDLEQLAEHLARMVKAKQAPEEFVLADVNFHLALGRAASNRILMNALHLIRNLLQKWILSAVSVEGVTSRACAQHKRVLLAIRNRDGAAARQQMRKHLLDMAAIAPRPRPGGD